MGGERREMIVRVKMRGMRKRGDSSTWALGDWKGGLERVRGKGESSRGIHFWRDRS